MDGSNSGWKLATAIQLAAALIFVATLLAIHWRAIFG
jgi:hypothetical protein